MTTTPSTLPLRAVFGIPAAIALVTLIGLVAALLDDGLYDAVSWVALAMPLLVLGWAGHGAAGGGDGSTRGCALSRHAPPANPDRRPRHRP